MSLRSKRRPLVRRLAIPAIILSSIIVAVEAGAFITRWSHNRRVRDLGDRLHMRVAGSGEPILFLHGLRASGRYWEPGIDSLAGDYETIVVDLLGFGRSPWPRDSAYDVDEHLSAVRRTVTPVLRGRKATVVGHSMGAVLAAEYARRHPEEISNLILLNAPMFRSASEAKDGVYEMSPMAAVFTFNPVLARGTCDLMCAARPLFYRMAPRMEPEVPPHVARDAVLHRWQSFDGTMTNVILASNLEQTLRAVSRDIPVTIIHGTGDGITSRQRLEDISAEVGADLVFLEGDHNAYLRNPDGVLNEIRRALGRAQ